MPRIRLLKQVPREPKMPPNMAPKIDKDRPQDGPRGPPADPKMAPRGLKMASKRPLAKCHEYVD